MIRIAALLPMLTATVAFAQSTVTDSSSDNAGTLAIGLFVLAFFGCCAWFAWMTWRNEKKNQKEPGGKSKG